MRAQTPNEQTSDQTSNETTMSSNQQHNNEDDQDCHHWLEISLALWFGSFITSSAASSTKRQTAKHSNENQCHDIDDDQCSHYQLERARKSTLAQFIRCWLCQTTMTPNTMCSQLCLNINHQEIDPNSLSCRRNGEGDIVVKDSWMEMLIQNGNRNVIFRMSCSGSMTELKCIIIGFSRIMGQTLDWYCGGQDNQGDWKYNRKQVFDSFSHKKLGNVLKISFESTIIFNATYS